MEVSSVLVVYVNIQSVRFVLFFHYFEALLLGHAHLGL